jgi:HSP20 family protein
VGCPVGGSNQNRLFWKTHGEKKDQQKMNALSRFSTPFSNASYSTFSGLDSLFDRVFGEDGQTVARQYVLPLSIWQDENNVYLEADLPGVAEKDLDITVHNGVLSVKAQRTDAEGRTYLYNGRAFGSVERAVTLPSDVDSTKVEAKLTSGILQISLPKSPEARPRKIGVKTS